VIEQLAGRFPAAAEMLADAGADILAFTGFPQPHWRQIWSNTQFMMRDVGVGRAA
jgi:transposase-like protein